MGPRGLSPGVEVIVSDDGMTAAVIVEADAAADAQTIRAALAAAGVVHGVDETAIEAAALPCARGRPVAVARGTPPVPPRDGAVERLFADRGRGPTEDESGRADFKNLGLIVNVHAGTPLARLRPPEEGRAGIDVRGRRTEPRAPRTATLSVGRNVVLSDDRCEARAAVDGRVVVDTDGRISVETSYAVPGDVGPETGHIDFLGTVSVAGGILDGFRVRAAGDVSVRGTVEGAAIESGGSIRIEGGIAGRGRALLVARGAIEARYAEDARLVASGDVKIRESLLRCSIVSGGTVRVGAGDGRGGAGGRGAVVGGDVSAEAGVEAAVLGAEGGARTLVEIGIAAAPRLRFDALEAEFRRARRRLLEIAREVGALEAARAAGRLPADRLPLLDALLAERDGLVRRVAAAALEARALDASAAAGDAFLTAREGAHPGVVIASAAHHLPIRSRTGAIRLRAVAGRLERAGGASAPETTT